MRKLEFILAAALTLPTAGCTWFRKAPPPPPAPKPAGPDIVPPKPKGKPAVIPPPPPSVGATSPGVPPVSQDPALPPANTTVVAPPPSPPPPKPAQVRRRAARTVPPKTEAVAPAQQPPAQPVPAPAPSNAPAAGPPAPAPAPAPEKPVQLGELLQDDERAEYEKEYQDNVAEAQKALGRMQGRTLTSEQEEERARVQNFLRQARESHPADLRNAVQLSKRAAVLAMELEKTVR